MYDLLSSVILRAIMTHASVPEKERKVLGISDTLIRLSVGLENEADVIEDLDQALNAAVNTTHSAQHDPISHCLLALRILCPVNSLISFWPQWPTGFAVSSL